MNRLSLRYKRSPFTEHQSENECRQRHNPADSICSRQRICQLLLGNTLRRDKIDHSSQRTILYHKIKRAAQVMHADPRKTLLAIAYHHTYPGETLQMKHLSPMPRHPPRVRPRTGQSQAAHPGNTHALPFPMHHITGPRNPHLADCYIRHILRMWDNSLRQKLI